MLGLKGLHDETKSNRNNSGKNDFNSSSRQGYEGSSRAAFAEGLDCEIIGFRALAKLWLEAKLKAEREHVTLYIRNHPELFNIIVKENETNDSKYRITVDEENDFLVVKTILENLYKGNDSYFTIEEIKSYLDTHPEVYRLNSNIIRNEGMLKSLQDD